MRSAQLLALARDAKSDQILVDVSWTLNDVVSQGGGAMLDAAMAAGLGELVGSLLVRDNTPDKLLTPSLRLGETSRDPALLSRRRGGGVIQQRCISNTQHRAGGGCVAAAAVARGAVKHRQVLLTPKVLARLNELGGKGDGSAAALAAVDVLAAAGKASQEAVAILIKEGSVEMLLRLLTRSSSVPTQRACAVGVCNTVCAGSMAQTKCDRLPLVSLFSPPARLLARLRRRDACTQVRGGAQGHRGAVRAGAQRRRAAGGHGAGLHAGHFEARRQR